MRRRAQVEWEQTVGLLIIVAAALVLVLWWYNTSSALNSEKQVDACRLSVLAHAKGFFDIPAVPSAVTDQANLFDIDCERRVITFTKTKAELNGKTHSFYDPDQKKKRDTYRALTPGIVNSVAASELATCWYQFLEGQSYWTNEVDPGNDFRACFVCSEIRFTPDAPAFTPQPLFPFLNASSSRPYPKIVPTNSITGKSDSPTYLQYLFLSERLCDHGGSYIMWKNWYEKYVETHPGASCPEAFFNLLMTDKIRSEAGMGGSGPLLDPDLELSNANSYLVILFQYGIDKGKSAGEKKAQGTTYAPLIIPSSDFSTKLCERYIG